ncbi:MAG: hypothetical protein KC486_35165 [Myxococcales bacterium]|nr:hypothetical protein [Myxococcales bacterium]
MSSCRSSARVVALALTLGLGCATQGAFFPPGALDGEAELDAWLGGWFEPALSALHEPALVAESGAHVVRVLVLPSFDHPLSMRVKIRRSGRGVLIVRRASGWGGYDPGYLARARRVPLSRAKVRRLLFLLERADFWVSGATFGYPGRNDGTTVVLEAVRGGQYHVVHDDYAGELAQIVRLLSRYAWPLRARRR